MDKQEEDEKLKILNDYESLTHTKICNIFYLFGYLVSYC